MNMDSNTRLDKKKLKADQEQVKQKDKDANIRVERGYSDDYDIVKDNPTTYTGGYYDSSDDEGDMDVNDERYIEYMKTIRESKGFHIPERPAGIKVPYIGSIVLNLKSMEEFARPALIWYMENNNNEDKEKYELVRVVRANARPAAGVVLYITFIGHAVGANVDVRFRAIVLDGIKIVDVYSCEIDPLCC